MKLFLNVGDSRELSSSPTSSWNIPHCSPSQSTRLSLPPSSSNFSWSGQSASSWEGLASSSPWTQSFAPLASERSIRGSSVFVDARNVRPGDSSEYMRDQNQPGFGINFLNVGGYIWGTSSISSSSMSSWNIPHRSSSTSTRPSRQHCSSNCSWSDQPDSPWKDLSSSSLWTQSPALSAPERPTRGSTVSTDARNVQLADSREYIRD